MPQQPAPRRSLGDRIRRLFSSAEQLEAEDLEARARDCGALPIAEAAPRTKVTFRGTVSSVTSSDTGWLEAELTDGTGSVKLVWMGRKRLECVLPGRHLLVSGRLASDEGDSVIYNPEFEVVS